MFMNYHKMVALFLSLCDRSFCIIFTVVLLLHFRHGFVCFVFCKTIEIACEMLSKNLPAC
jgi:hypothetical protein